MAQNTLGFTVMVNGVEKSVTNINELKLAIKQMEGELKEMDKTSEAFDNLQSRIRDARSEYRNFVKDTKAKEVKDQFVMLSGAVSSSMNTATGALETFGVKSAAAAEISSKASGALTVVNQALALSELRVEASTALKTIAVKVATAAQWLYNAALKANPIGWAIAGITALAGAYALVTGAMKKAKDASEIVTGQQETMIEVNKRAAQSFGDEKAKLDILIGVATNENLSKKERVKAVKQLQDMYPNYLGNLKLEGDQIVGLKEGYDKLVKAMYVKAQVEGASALSAEKYKEMITEGAKYGVYTLEGMYSKFNELDDKYRKSGKTSDFWIVQNFGDKISAYKNASDAVVNLQTKLFNMGGPPTGKGTGSGKETKEPKEDPRVQWAEEVNKMILQLQRKGSEDQIKESREADLTKLNNQKKTDLEEFEAKAKKANKNYATDELYLKGVAALNDFYKQEEAATNQKWDDKDIETKKAQAKKVEDLKKQLHMDSLTNERDREQQALQDKHDAALAEIDQLVTDETTKNQMKLQLEENYRNDQAALNKKYNEQELQTELAKLTALENMKNQFWQAVASGFGALSQLFKKNSAASKVAALAEIAISTGSAFISGLRIAQKTAEGTGPLAAWTFPVFYATQVAAILSAVVKAKSILSGGDASGGADIGKAKSSTYARGGILRGPSHAAGGIMSPFGELEGGEAIINRRSTSMFGSLLSSINQAGGGMEFESNSVNKQQTPILKAYVVSSEMTSSQEAQSKIDKLARL